MTRINALIFICFYSLCYSFRSHSHKCFANFLMHKKLFRYGYCMLNEKYYIEDHIESTRIEFGSMHKRWYISMVVSNYDENYLRWLDYAVWNHFWQARVCWLNSTFIISIEDVIYRWKCQFEYASRVTW